MPISTPSTRWFGFYRRILYCSSTPAYLDLPYLPLMPVSTIFNFFGLRENPFKINPDPRFLFITDRTHATSAELVYAIRTRKGLILLTGEVGTGKTMLIRRLLDWLSEQGMPTALIFNSHIKPEHLLDFILNDFGVPCSSTLKSEKLMALNRWLLERYRAGQTPALIVDEAQGLDTAALEEIRLLLNFETPREKLLQIVLAGQPELETKLKRHELRQLRQRITVRCRTEPLSLEQTYGYIGERLRIAGSDGRRIFEPDAVGAIHAYSHGIPRVINVLAENSLVNACAEGASIVSANAVEQAAHDCQLDRVDSVARILNTRSDSTGTLSDIGSLLATISSETDAAVGPVGGQPAWQSPLSALTHIYDRQPLAVEGGGGNLAGAKNHLELEKDVTEVERPPVETHQVQEMSRQSQSFSAFQDPTAARALPVKSAARSNPSLFRFLHRWSNTFVADARATSGQLRRAVRSFGARRWTPFVGELRRQLHQLRGHAQRLRSDPRWIEIRNRAASVSRTFWTSFKSATPGWFAKGIGIRRQKLHKHSQDVGSRARRGRVILSLRKWLHEPLDTQQKRAESARRRSAG
jgi:general secretion pathway protein A